MIKLIWFWLLGKTLKLYIGYAMGEFIVSQITVESKFNGGKNIVISLEEKDSFKIKSYDSCTKALAHFECEEENQ
jgi:hypothetical protein